MKIICIGLNYPDRAAELGTVRPPAPEVFLKPDSAILRANNPFFVPDWANRFEYEAQIVVRINRLGRYIHQKFAGRYYQELGVGVSVVARDLQKRLADEGRPWDLATAFDQSAAVSPIFLDKQELPGGAQNTDFRLEVNGVTAQSGNTRDMYWGIDQIIESVSRHFTLKTGDLIFTGTPAGPDQMRIGDHLRAYVGERPVMDFKVR